MSNRRVCGEYPHCYDCSRQQDCETFGGRGLKKCDKHDRYYFEENGCPECVLDELNEQKRKDERTKRDIICPECKGMLEDIVTPNMGNHLYCKKCNIEWRV